MNLPKIIRGMPDEEYHRHPAFGSTDLKTARRSAAHYLARKRGADEETPAKRDGKILHTCVLQPHLFDAQYIVLPKDAPQRPTEAMIAAAAKGTAGDNSLARIAWWEAFDANNTGKTVIANALYDQCRRIAEAVREHPSLRGFFTAPDGEAELSVFANDPETGLACKGRFDHRVRIAGMLTKLELKFCEDVRPHKFRVACEQYGYFMQDAYYQDLATWSGDPLDASIIIAVEKEDATCYDAGHYPIKVYEFGPSALARGRDQYREALALLKHCSEVGEYPAYDPEIEVLEPPSWAT